MTWSYTEMEEDTEKEKDENGKEVRKLEIE